MSTLRIYKLFKNILETEKYPYMYNKGHRQAYSHFRLCTYNLNIEKGRWHRKLINVKMQVIPVNE